MCRTCKFYLPYQLLYPSSNWNTYVYFNTLIFITIGAPTGKRMIIFVDDLNMPKLDRYGSQPPIELLRQYQDFKGLYDREKLFWKEIKDVTICAACAPPGGGRNPVTPRMIRHFSMLCLPTPSDISLKAIFSVRNSL